MKAEIKTSLPAVDLKIRTRAFALVIIRLYATLPKSELGRVIGRQILRSGTSVGAHYREVTRARSDAEFVSKLEGGCQELEETMYWLEIIGEANLLPPEKLSHCLTESNELMAIFSTIITNRKKVLGR
ncbi:four helix bundle protein [soil metagenome]